MNNEHFYKVYYIVLNRFAIYCSVLDHIFKVSNQFLVIKQFAQIFFQ